MKKYLILIIGTAFLLTGCSNKCENDNLELKINSNETTTYTVTSDISITSTNSSTTTINAALLNELSFYSINANVGNHFATENHDYVGVKLSDLIAKLAPNDYTRIYFTDGDNMTLILSKDSVTSNMYLVFTQDNSEIMNDTPVVLANFGDYNSTWLYNLKTIKFVKVSE